MIDIRTFVRHLSVLILAVRDEYHQIYISRREKKKPGSKLMEDVFHAEESPQFGCFPAILLRPRALKQISSKSSSINHFEIHLRISSLITMTRVNRLEGVKHSIKVAFDLLL